MKLGLNKLKGTAWLEEQKEMLWEPLSAQNLTIIREEFIHKLKKEIN